MRITRKKIIEAIEARYPYLKVYEMYPYKSWNHDPSLLPGWKFVTNVATFDDKVTLHADRLSDMTLEQWADSFVEEAERITSEHSE